MHPADISLQKSRVWFLKPDLLASWGLLLLLFVFFPRSFLAKDAPLIADHLEQHYPWAFLMAQSLRQGIWPFWTPLIQCGFPIVAESQMGFFYLPNLLLYTLLPFQWAYAYMPIFHFFFSGLGTYLYCRRIGLAPIGAFVAATVFVFGAGYGGAYYNITSLKTLTWFPWILWSFEKYRGALSKRYVLLTAFFMSLSILAGYLQVAALMMLICAVYFLLRLLAFSETSQSWKDRIRAGGGMVLATAAAIVLSLPQLLLTFELAMFSNRINLSEDYAYVGSMSPGVLLTLFFPNLQGIFRGNCLYSGIFALFFVCAAFFVVRKDLRTALWLWVTVALVSLFLALGQWSPLYVSFVKITHFYSFRVPAKFLIFMCFSIAILSGFGVHACIEESTKPDNRFRTMKRIYLYILTGILMIWGLVYFFVTAGRSIFLKAGNWMVVNFIYGRSGHPHTLDSYFEAVKNAASTIRDHLVLNNPWQIWAFVLIIISGVWVLFIKQISSKARGAMSWLAFAIAVLLIDLYVFAGTDIKKDFGPSQKTLKPNVLIQTLLAEKGSGTLGRIYGFRKESETLPLVPSVNMFYGIEDIGGYSPFIMSRYFETLGQFGNVNDSNRMNESDPPFVLSRMPLLNALDVSHVLSTRELSHPDLELLTRDPVSSAYLYRNKGKHARGYFIAGTVRFFEWTLLKQTLMAPGFDPQQILLLENTEKDKIFGVRIRNDAKATKILCSSYKNDRETWVVETTGPGFFIVSKSMYPGWEVHLNGEKAPLLRAYGLFQAVWIPDGGKHSVEFRYRPYRGLWQSIRNRGF